MKNLIKFSIVMVVLCITACTQTFENTSNEVQKKAQGRLVMKVGNESRTIKPAIGESDVKTAVLTANGEEIKRWTGDNIINQIQSTEDILLDVGNYNFTMTFRNANEIEILTATTSKDIVTGDNILKFDMKPVESEEPAEIYLTFKNIETGATEEYLSPNYPWNDSIWMSQWEFVSQRQEGGSQSFGFSILDENGDDYTDLLFDTEMLFVFVAPYLDEMTEKDFNECQRIYDFANENGFNYLWITSVNPEYVYELQDKYYMFDEVYYGDELELKSMVRSNPGLMLMNSGVVVDKWSKIDFPSQENFKTLEF